MDAPPIQYARTVDGVGIAYWTLGEGPPLLLLPAFVSHLLAEWELDLRRNAYLRLAERATIIRYDPRGMGLSQSDSLNFSAEASVRDIEAVVDHLELRRFAICGPWATNGATFTYPASHPERVSRLVITVAPVQSGALRRIAALRSFADYDWDSFAEIYARLLFGWDHAGASQMAGLVKAAHSASSYWAASDAIAAFIAEPWLPRLAMPVLILYGLGNTRAARIAKALASGIPRAPMLGLPGWPYGVGVNETVANAILDFINATPAAPGASIPAPQIDISAVRTIVFTDVEGSTALNERLGDEGAREVLREHERLTREALGEHGGSEVKAMGDGSMVWFPSATRAVECAIALQRAFAERNRGVGAEQLPPDVPSSDEGLAVAQPLRASVHGQLPLEPIRVRIGINAGEPIAEGDDLFGASVIATARVASAAKGGQILTSDVVRQLLAGKGFSFIDQGEHALKGFDEPARLFEVRWLEDA